jgi:hypothetical protein
VYAGPGVELHRRQIDKGLIRIQQHALRHIYSDTSELSRLTATTLQGHTFRTHLGLSVIYTVTRDGFDYLHDISITAHYFDYAFLLRNALSILERLPTSLEVAMITRAGPGFIRTSQAERNLIKYSFCLTSEENAALTDVSLMHSKDRLRGTVMSHELDHTIRGLTQALARNEVVVFCGAGVSRHSGMPLVAP